MHVYKYIYIYTDCVDIICVYMLCSLWYLIRFGLTHWGPTSHDRFDASLENATRVFASVAHDIQAGPVLEVLKKRSIESNDLVQNCFTALGDTMSKRFEREGYSWPSAVLQSTDYCHSAEQTLLATSGHPEPLSLASQVISQWIKRCYSLQRQGRLGKTPRLGPRGQFSEARSFHSFNENVALHIMLPSLQLTYHLKIDGWKTTFVWGRPIFRGYVLFVLGRVHDMYMILLLMSWCPVGLCAESW